MADQLTPAQQLHALLAPATREGMDAIQNDQSGLLKRMSNRYQDALIKQSPQQLAQTIGDISRQLNNAGFLQPTAERVLDTFDFKPYETRIPAPAEQPAQQAQPANPLAGVLGGGREKKAPLPTTSGDRATPVLQSLQEEQLLAQFEQAINIENDAERAVAIDNLLSHIEAPKLLGNQVEIIKNHIFNTQRIQDQLTRARTQEEKNQIIKKTNDDIANVYAKKQKQWDDYQTDPKKTDTQKVRDAQVGQQDEVLLGKFHRSVLDKNSADARSTFQDLVRHRLDQTAPYSILQEYAYGAGQDLLLEQLRSQFLQASNEISQQRQHYFQGIQRTEMQRATNQQERAGYGMRLLGAAQRTSKRGKGLLGNKAIGAAAKAAGPEAVVGLWVVRHWKLVFGILAAIIFFSFAVFVLIIAALGASSQNQPTPQPGPISFESCSPSSACVQQLQNNGIIVSGNLSLNGDPFGKAKLVFDTLALATRQPSRYGSLLGLPKNTILISFYDGPCKGHASTNGIVNLYGFGSCGTGVAQFMLLHELGHEIAFRNPNLYQKFANQFPFPLLVFYRLPTYNCEFDYGIGPFQAECFADMVGEYVVYKYYRNTVGGRPFYFEATFSSFKNLFAPFYNFAKDNIYNGVEF